MKRDTPPATKGDMPPSKERDVPPPTKGDTPPTKTGNAAPTKAPTTPPTTKGDTPPAKERDVPPPTKGDTPPVKPSETPDKAGAPQCDANDQTCKAKYADKAPDGPKETPAKVPEDFVKTVANKSCSGIIGFMLVDVESGKDLFVLREGDIIPRDEMLTIRAVSSPGFDVGDVRFSLAGKFIRTEEYYPYSLSGDNTRGSFFPWAARKTLEAGLHKLSATPEFGAGLDVRVKFVDGNTVAFPKDRSLTTFLLRKSLPPCGLDKKTVEQAKATPDPNAPPTATPCRKHAGAHKGGPDGEEEDIDITKLKKEVANGDCPICAKRSTSGFAEKFAVERVCEAVYADAPLWTSPEDGMLFYSDPPKKMVLMWNSSTGDVTPLWKTSGLVNGLAWTGAGKVLATQRVVGRIVEFDIEDAGLPEKAETRTVVDKFDGKKLSDPNDLVVSKDGDIFFSDPPHYNSTDMAGLSHVNGKVFVLLNGNDQPTLIDGTLKRPQGVVLDKNEKYLYVSDWQTRSWLRYDVENGKASGDWNKVVAHQVPPEDRREGRPDGMCIDDQDRIFAAGPGGIWLFGPGFTYEGVIPTPEGAIAVTETTLGEIAGATKEDPNEKVLFFTTDEGVYKMSRRALDGPADKLV
ncbi:hypothetical protein BU14_1719s0001 [Porphyra umbilicalis]|uniref:SMP-30/Gluconolactonase/LRE-like region domain-containing protein n=1 Tax=Porphyra umbilicalis TaxID=2786 RepID=A0A1X6NKV9_PORUM|nr:hypothetical protein BU14_1719s0001 [Porphyra umbilicalis]|eukprot:OSX69227.1 hypothetical protein BU14_1719s0001 [Porphyra umbilicalis]